MPQWVSTSCQNLVEMTIWSAPSAAVQKKMLLLNLVAQSWAEENYLVSHSQPAVCCFRQTSENKWQTLGFQARSPIPDLSVQAICFKGIFLSTLENNFTTELKYLCWQQLRHHWLIKTENTSGIIFFFHRKLPTCSNKEKTIKKVLAAKATKVFSGEKPFISEKNASMQLRHP